MPTLLRMTPFEALSTGLGVLSVILIPLLIALIRGAVKWTRVESKLEVIANRLGELVADQDRMHTALVEQMRDDRRATDERLRWLERRRGAHRPNGAQT